MDPETREAEARLWSARLFRLWLGVMGIQAVRLLAFGREPQAVIAAHAWTWGFERGLALAVAAAVVGLLVCGAALVRLAQGDARRALLASSGLVACFTLGDRLKGVSIPSPWDVVVPVLGTLLMVSLTIAFIGYMARAVGRQTQADVDARLGIRRPKPTPAASHTPLPNSQACERPV
ncbi:hypothetical protein [Paludisphaera mucosa]|uniref:Uncharacterized protein n=1 Tax=Paludisphaera mucosa TaxID=3030827 RepID=A0ABT6FBH6_9BACT|nr:hypothetical protein [Paludisphaera mucosa]MDG3004904.1 hypothetical protein [Paludisphaera mucosa]